MIWITIVLLTLMLLPAAMLLFIFIVNFIEERKYRGKR